VNGYLLSDTELVNSSLQGIDCLAGKSCFLGSRILMLIHKNKCASNTDFLALPSSSFRGSEHRLTLNANSESLIGYNVSWQ